MIGGISFVDIGLAVFLLIFVIIGAKKGFMLSLLGLIGTLVSLIVAIFLAQRVADLLYPVFGMGDAINKWSTGIISGILNPDADPGNMFAIPLGAPENISGIVNEALSKLGLPAFIITPLGESISGSIGNYVANSGAAILEEMSIINVLAPIMTNVIMLFIAGLLTFIVIRIIVAILSAIVKAILKSSKALRGADRWLGALLGAVKTVVFALVVFTISFFLLGNAITDTPSEETTGIRATVNNSINQSTAGRFIYDKNPFPKLITDNLNIQNIIDDIFGNKAAEQQETTPEATETPPAEEVIEG